MLISGCPSCGKNSSNVLLKRNPQRAARPCPPGARVRSLRAGPAPVDRPRPFGGTLSTKERPPRGTGGTKVRAHHGRNDRSGRSVP
jgi:hypothetical protein